MTGLVALDGEASQTDLLPELVFDDLCALALDIDNAADSRLEQSPKHFILVGGHSRIPRPRHAEIAMINIPDDRSRCSEVGAEDSELVGAESLAKASSHFGG